MGCLMGKRKKRGRERRRRERKREGIKKKKLSYPRSTRCSSSSLPNWAEDIEEERDPWSSALIWVSVSVSSYFVRFLPPLFFGKPNILIKSELDFFFLPSPFPHFQQDKQALIGVEKVHRYEIVFFLLSFFSPPSPPFIFCVYFFLIPLYWQFSTSALQKGPLQGHDNANFATKIFYCWSNCIEVLADNFRCLALYSIAYMVFLYQTS